MRRGAASRGGGFGNQSDQEVANARGHFPEETHPHLDRLTRALVRKLLHHPSSHLRAAGRGDPERLEMTRRLFRLDED